MMIFSCFWTGTFIEKKNQPKDVITTLFFSVFDSVVMVAFQITFHVEIHVNNVFSFLENYFSHQHIKTIQKVQTPLNFSKKQLKFDQTRVQPQS